VKTTCVLEQDSIIYLVYAIKQPEGMSCPLSNTLLSYDEFMSEHRDIHQNLRMELQAAAFRTWHPKTDS